MSNYISGSIHGVILTGRHTKYRESNFPVKLMSRFMLFPLGLANQAHLIYHKYDDKANIWWKNKFTKKSKPRKDLHVSSLTRRGTIQQKWGFCSKACGLNPKNVSTPLKVRINWSFIAWQCNKVTYNPGNAN